MKRRPLDRNQLTGVGLALLATVALSVAGGLVKLGLGEAQDAVTLLALRFLVAAAALWIIFPLFSPQTLKANRRTLLDCGGVALANTTSLLCFYLASDRLPVSVVLIIFSLYPAVAVILLALRGERITWQVAGRLLLAGAGVLLLTESAEWNDPLGLLLAFCVPVAYSLHMVLAQWRLKDVPAPTVTLYTISIMAGLMGLIFLARFRGWQPLSSLGWSVILITGLVSTALARLANFGAIQRIGSGQVALLGPVGNLMSVFWALALLGEYLTPIQWLGGGLILLSAVQGVRPRE